MLAAPPYREPSTDTQNMARTGWRLWFAALHRAVSALEGLFTDGIFTYGRRDGAQVAVSRVITGATPDVTLGTVFEHNGLGGPVTNFLGTGTGQRITVFLPVGVTLTYNVTTLRLSGGVSFVAPGSTVMDFQEQPGTHVWWELSRSWVG